MYKKLLFVAIFGVIISGFCFPNSVSAIEGEPIPGVDVNLGTTSYQMAPADLGIEDIGTLPTSPFYFLKEWKRGLSRLITFDAVAEAELELAITNEKAAEALEVEALSPTDTNAIEKAFTNFANAQTRLNAQLAKLSDVSENKNIAELIKKVDEKTAKHSELLQKMLEKWSADPYAEDAARNGTIGDPDFDLRTKTVRDAWDKTWKTSAITVTLEAGIGTPTGSVNFLMQKAADQIEKATTALDQANSALGAVSTTRGTWQSSGSTEASANVTVPKQTQGTTFGEKAQNDDTAIFDRWGNTIAKAEARLSESKKLFAEEKYGEAYGLARSVEALTGRLNNLEDSIRGGAMGDMDGDGADLGSENAKQKEQASSTTSEKKPSKTINDKVKAVASSSPTSVQKTPSSSVESSIESTLKVTENESPNPADRTTVPTATTTTATSATEKKDATTVESSGAAASPSSNYSR